MKAKKFTVLLIAICVITLILSTVVSCKTEEAESTTMEDTKQEEKVKDEEKTEEETTTEVKLVDATFSDYVEGLPKIQAPEGFDWRQCEGVTLNFISENTTPSVALKDNIEIFEEVTGITVNIEQAALDIVVEKIVLDINAKSSKYQLLYAATLWVLANHSDSLVDLNTFINNPDLPSVPGGLEDFNVAQLETYGYMNNKDALYGLPYDAPTMILAYRTDIFAKYKDLFQEEKGYDWTPGLNLTWDQYYEIGSWINDKVADGTITEVEYGIGHQAKQANSLSCDFTNVLAAFGGSYFEVPDIDRIGATDPGKSALTSDEALEAAEFYKKLMGIAAPGSTTWDWSDLAEAFAVGNIAMTPQWHEFSAFFEDTTQSQVAGNVGWTMLPKKVRHANLDGGTGLAISKYTSEKEQLAAWMFIVWATSPQAQYLCLSSDVGGSTPTRRSVYELPDVIKGMQLGTEESKRMPNLLSSAAALEAWKSENVVFLPKFPQWAQADTVIYSELSKMLTTGQSSADTMSNIADQIDAITGN